MPDKIPDSLKGLRVRLVTPASGESAPVEQQAYRKLKKILSEHGQHLGEKTLASFRQSLNGLLLDGLRARHVEAPKSATPKPQNTPDESWVRFKASDGKLYLAHPESWPKVQKRDAGARKYSGKPGASSEQRKGSLADRLFADAVKGLG